MASVDSGSGSSSRPSLSPDDILSRLDPEQRQVAEALRGPVRVLAGAGTGKTRAVTHRIAYGVACGVYSPTQVLAVTFTTRAAGELRGRLRELGAGGVQARTFHSAALRQARYFWPRVYGGELPAIVESKLSMVGGAARSCRVDTSQATLRDLASEIEWCKVTNVTPELYPTLAPDRGRSVAGVEPKMVAKVFTAYEERKRQAERIDLEDVLLCAAAVLAEDPRVAAAVRSQYQHFVVDEFQDVSPIQAALLELWLGGRHDLCVVGDPLQTIYSFAGASAQHLVEFPRVHPGTTSIELVRNYRSSPAIVAAANEVNKRGRTKGVVLQAQAPAVDGSPPSPQVAYSQHTDEVAEAEAIGARVKELIAGGVPVSDVAVLYRINAQSEAYEAALATRGVPYSIRGSERFFDRAEVREAVTLLRGEARAAQHDVEFVHGAGGAVSPAPSGPGDNGGHLPEDQVTPRVRAVLAGRGWSLEPPTVRGQVRDRWESLNALVELSASFVAERPGASLVGLVAELDRRSAEQHAPGRGGVTLATVHSAKGLEWDAVFVAGAVEGTFPFSATLDSPNEVEEERRLFYVALTRARTYLHISWAQARQPGGRASRKPSRFLDGLRPADAVTTSSPAAANKSRRKSECRICAQPLYSTVERKIGRHEGCESSYDEKLFEALRSWRAETAKAASVPAYVVFTDLTLQAIAEQRPANQRALSKISGVGSAKLDKYADEVLGVLAQH